MTVDALPVCDDAQGKTSWLVDLGDRRALVVDPPLDLRAVHAAVGRLAAGPVDGLPTGAAVMCGHGERAMTAASLLERAGRTDVAVVLGGPQDWARDTGQRLDVGA